MLLCCISDNLANQYMVLNLWQRLRYFSVTVLKIDLACYTLQVKKIHICTEMSLSIKKHFVFE